jgi:Uma2 family endonuclease
MASLKSAREIPLIEPLPIIYEGMPLLYEDEEEGDMGETNPHSTSEHILRYGVAAHLADRPEYQVFSNMNLYYSPQDRRAYISPDTMVVEPYVRLEEDVSSYRIGENGPSPILAAEVLSERTAQQRDLDEKMDVYAQLGVPEYILVDLTGRFLSERLLLKRLQPNRTWQDEQDPDGGVTSQLGFRLIIDTDGRLRVLDATTGKRYARPDEAQAEADARREAEKHLEEEAEARQRAAAGRREAERQARAEAKARREAEKQARAEAKAHREAEKARREAEKRSKAEEKARREAEKRSKVEEKARREAEKRSKAEEKARREVEKQLRALEAELARLRAQPPVREEE